MKLPDNEYLSELEKVAKALITTGSEVSIRGDGAAIFVFATNSFRSIEISQSGDDVWVEFWRSPDEVPTHEVTVTTYTDAARIAQEWLESVDR